ncbi:hypothetical protein [Sphingomonas jatrophae]|uniref:hypothetical protein n=1 Tax=Sphingomonas jatrophae TaxID=1166337 RepID=UPI001041DCE4|nr:hypothetical protein [Sphingomonas jatrophae]
MVAFYGAGYLLAFGYFLGMGPGLMTGFSLSELALVGFARLSGEVAVGAFLAFFMVTAAHLLAAWTPKPRTAKHAERFAGAVSAAAAVAIVAASWHAGFLAALLGVVAATMSVVFAAASRSAARTGSAGRGTPGLDAAGHAAGAGLAGARRGGLPPGERGPARALDHGGAGRAAGQGQAADAGRGGDDLRGGRSAVSRRAERRGGDRGWCCGAYQGGAATGPYLSRYARRGPL